MFGGGPHFCLGYHVAIAEGTLVLLTLARALAEAGLRVVPEFADAALRPRWLPVTHPSASWPRDAVYARGRPTIATRRVWPWRVSAATEAGGKANRRGPRPARWPPGGRYSSPEAVTPPMSTPTRIRVNPTASSVGRSAGEIPVRDLALISIA
jgi:hypothetical protein